MLSPIAGKIIPGHIKPHLRSLIKKSRLVSYFGHIESLGIILEQFGEFRSPFHLFYFDFETAFDSVGRMGQECSTQKRAKLIDIITATYACAKGHILSRCEIFEGFEVKSGVRENCILLPTLFLVIRDQMARKWKKDAAWSQRRS